MAPPWGQRGCRTAAGTPGRSSVGDDGGGVEAVRRIGPAAGFRRLAAGDAPVLRAGLDLAARVADDRDPGQLRGVAVVGVDADECLAGRGGGDVVDDDVALVLRLAVAAGAVQLAEVVHLEIADVHGAGAVVLEDLVRRLARAAAVDGHRLRGRGALEGRGVFADVLPPDVEQRAGAQAVDA